MTGRGATPQRGLAGMHPAYFALVMATGIVSLACELLDPHPIAIALFYRCCGSSRSRA